MARKLFKRNTVAWFGVAVALLVVGATASAAQQPAPPDFLVTARSNYGVDETLNRVKSAIEAENLMIIQEIDAQKMLRMVGMRTGGMRQLLFFHPRYMKRIVETNRNGALEPPLKVAVMERPDGKVIVRYVDPAYQFGRYEGLEELGEELKGVVDTIAASVSH